MSLLANEAPHRLVGKVPHQAEHNGMGEGDRGPRATSGQGEEDTRSQEVEENRSIDRHRPHCLFVLYCGKKVF